MIKNLIYINLDMYNKKLLTFFSFIVEKLVTITRIIKIIKKMMHVSK